MTRILIIEDEAPLREGITEMLELEGFEVISAENGQSGLTLAEQQPPDLIICDVMMPALNGYDVLYEVRQHSHMALVPFIFLTAKSEKTDMRYAMQLGADDYLTKPFSRKDLLKAIDTRLTRQIAMREALNQNLEDAKKTFTRMVAHELRTPLISIQMVQEIILRKIDQLSRDELLELVESLGSGSRRLSHLVEQLVFMTQLESQMISRNSIQEYGQPCRLSEIVKSSVEMAQRYATRQGNVSVRLVEQHQAMVICESRALKHALAEIITNALNFSPDGGEVLITQWVEGGMAHVRVLDRGEGIPEEHIPGVLENFYQVNREVHEQQGIGMGLPLTRRIVEAHSGSLTLHSIVGKGTLVEIHLPLHQL